MGAGLALEFRQRFPGLYTALRAVRMEIGGVWFWDGGDTGAKFVCCLPTKDGWEKCSEIWMIEAGLEVLAEEIARGGKWTDGGIAFPKLGCGLGGLRWDGQVRPLMERYLAGLAAEVYVHV